jgi:proteasome activator subunit 4
VSKDDRPAGTAILIEHAVNKTLCLFGAVVDCLQSRIFLVADKYIDVLFDNANTGYAEV